MENSNPTKHWWMLVTRGILYISIGICLFLFAGTFTSLSAQLIAGLLLAAGVLGLVYTFGNVRTDRNYIWELLRSLSDVAFGIALFVSSKQDVDDFLSTLSFWAMMYAFIQVVQAMYSFMQSGVGSSISLSGKLIYFLGVVISGSLSYVLLMRPNGLDGSLGVIGLFPIALGVIITVLAVQQKRQAATANNSPKPY
jgi:uncharacterized membrane protein HdeD (DUF308 family)